jgi:5-methylcytosine-specific restriction enzyme B
MAIASVNEDRPELDRCYDASCQFVDRSLRADDSLFRPGTAIWTPAVIDDLYRRFVESPDASADTFENKLRRQLSGAPDETILLAAELMFVHLLIAADISGDTKRGLINEILAWASEPVAIPKDLDDALDVGLASTGIAFKTYRPHQLWFLMDFIRAWKGMSEADRARLLDDPWAFRAFVWELPMKTAYSQRHALLHLVHPETFEDIVSREYKQLIVDRFRDRVDESVDNEDHALFQIRSRLEDEAGGPISFHRSPIVEQWRPSKEPSEDNTEVDAREERRAWLIRGANVKGHNLVPAWLSEGYCSIGWARVGPVEAGTTRQALAERVDESRPDEPPGAQRNHVGNLYRFLNEITVGDLVVTIEGSKVYVGVVASEPTWVETDPHGPRRRAVEWTNPNQPIPRDQLSSSAFSKLRTLLTVSEVTEDVAEFAELAGLMAADTVPSRREPAVGKVTLAPVPQELESHLFVPQSWLQEIVDLLDEKRQIVFYGPPGTGKTYVAQRLATHITSQGGTFTLVQFHPSYAYEDFVEGFRPRQATASDTGIAFELTPGPLRQIADAAREDPENPYVLIIDEINRANLAKVFGELYFLLEYRDEAISLQYSPGDEFKLPRNLFFIATMNTADRSIALVDSAMRRRFYFVPFLPNHPPIDGLLRRWLDRKGLPKRPAELLEALNHRIEDEEAKIGPSYLMTERIDTADGLERIWRHAILPLLEEQHYGSGVDVHARFGLDALRHALARESADTPSAPTEPGAAEDVEDGA